MYVYKNKQLILLFFSLLFYLPVSWVCSKKQFLSSKIPVTLRKKWWQILEQISRWWFINIFLIILLTARAIVWAGLKNQNDRKSWFSLFNAAALSCSPSLSMFCLLSWVQGEAWPCCWFRSPILKHCPVQAQAASQLVKSPLTGDRQICTVLETLPVRFP